MFVFSQTLASQLHIFPFPLHKLL